jgi:hypothetical protein
MDEYRHKRKAPMIAKILRDTVVVLMSLTVVGAGVIVVIW